MKILTINFLTCAVKACKTSPLSFPLHFRDAELERFEIEYNPTFLQNILPRLDWDAIKLTATEVGGEGFLFFFSGYSFFFGFVDDHDDSDDNVFFVRASLYANFTFFSFFSAIIYLNQFLST